MSQEQKRTTRRGFITTTATAGMGLYLAACGGSSSSSSSSARQLERGHQQRGGGGPAGAVTLNNLFQQQAGYSAADLAGMTKLFEQANPNIKVNNTLVAYEALHDKIVAAAPAGTYDVVLGDCIWPAEFGSKGIVKDISLRREQPAHQPDLPRRAGHGRLQEQVLRDAVDPGHQVHVRQRVDAQEGGGLAGLAEDLGRRGRPHSSRSRPRGWSSTRGWAAGHRPRPSSATTPSCSAPSAASSWTPRASRPSRRGGGLQALEFMKMLLDQGLADPASTSSLEADVLKAFAQGKIAMNLNWTFQLAGALDPKQSQVTKDDVMILHTPAGTRGRPGAGLQRRPAGDDHQRHQAPQRGLGVRQVHHQPDACRTSTWPTRCRSGRRPTTTPR